MVIREALEYGIKNLSTNQYTNPLNESREILSFLMDKDISYFHVYPEVKLHPNISSEFKRIIDLRKKGYPIQYITNTAHFFGRDFYIDERALIPRWDTENLIVQVKELAKKMDSCNILELGAGSGAISITLAMEIKKALVLGLDISKEALEVCDINKKKYKIDNVEFIESNLFEKINEKYDIIVSNPPYIPISDLNSLQIEVKKEPRLALDGGEDGLDFYRNISKDASDYLKENGILIYEIGHNQFEQVYNILFENSYEDINYKCDLQNFKRVIWGRKGEI